MPTELLFIRQYLTEMMLLQGSATRPALTILLFIFFLICASLYMMANATPGCEPRGCVQDSFGPLGTSTEAWHIAIAPQLASPHHPQRPGAPPVVFLWSQVTGSQLPISPIPPPPPLQPWGPRLSLNPSMYEHGDLRSEPKPFPAVWMPQPPGAAPPPRDHSLNP